VKAKGGGALKRRSAFARAEDAIERRMGFKPRKGGGSTFK
jgi:hypothetical protein